MTASWALTTPLYGSPDEPAHVLRAVSIVRGQVVPPGSDGLVRVVDVPAFFASVSGATCFAFKPTQPADCQELPNGRGEESIETSAGLYPPLYYFPVGAISLALPNEVGLFGMRIVHAALCSLCLATGLTLLRRLGKLAVVGGLVAATPMAVFMSSVVNPNGLEIALGFLIASCSLFIAVVDTPREPRLVLLLGFSGAALVLVRQAGFVWLGLIAVVALVVGGVQRWRTVAWNRQGATAATLILAAAVAQAAWLRAVDFADVASQPLFIGLPANEVLRRSARKSWDLVLEMIGNFGWLDTWPPKLTWALALFALGTMILLGASVGSARMRVALAFAITMTFAVPIALEFGQVPRFGFLWQGRYSLPFAVVLPILGALAMRKVLDPVLARTGFPVVLAGIAAAAHVLSFYAAARRYAVGTNGRLNVLWGKTAWAPPLPIPLMVVIFTSATTCLCVVFLRRARVKRASPEMADVARAWLVARADSEHHIERVKDVSVST